MQKDDVIYRRVAINAIKTWGLIDGLSEGQAIEILADEEKTPSAQLEQKKGKWIDGRCSNCGCNIPAYIEWQKDMNANFCPNCGYDMRDGNNET